jgi:hypothetical protein
MAETIAHGQIQIDLNDEATLAGLRRIETQFDRTMHKIDREEAHAKIDADLAPLEDKVANAKRRLRQLEAQKTELPIHANTKELDLQITAARRNLKRLDGERATVEIKVKGQQNVIKAQEAIEKATLKRIEAIEKREQQAFKLADTAEKRRIAGVRQSARVQTSLWNQRMRELSQAHSAAVKINDEMDRERAALPRLQREYVETARKLEGFAEARRKAFGDQRSRQVIDFKIAEAEAKMRGLKATLERIGGPIDLDVDIHPGRDFGRRLRGAVSEAGVSGALHLAGMDAADKFAVGFRRRFSKAGILGFGARVTHRIGDIFGNLSQATVRLGPFTATIRQLGLVMAVLGPTILDVVGAIGALVPALGAGIMGAATLGAGAVTGLGLGFLGLKFAMRNTGQEITNVRTYINALQKATEKYGAGSDQAKKKQKELNHALGEVSPLARETALGIERFYANWDKRTKETSKNLGLIAHDGFQALDKIGPQWAKRTNELSGILQRGMRGAFKFLGSTRGRGILDSIMGNFNAAMPALLHGLGSLGKAFLNFAKIGSSFLPEFTAGFDHFAQTVLDFTESDRFPSVVKGWMDSAKNLVRFFSSAGHFLVSFFSPGLEAGNRLVTTMGNALDRWDRFNRSVEGQRQLADFFDQSVSGAQQLYGVLAPIAATFVTWAANLSPVVSQFLKGAAFASNFVAQIVKLVGLQGGLGTLAATLGALWAVGKISAATRAVVGFSRALLGLKAAETIAGAGGIAGRGKGIGAVGVTPAVVATTERAAGAMSRAGRASMLLRGGLTAIGAAIGFANPLVGAAVIGIGALAFAISKAHSKTDELKDDFRDAGKQAGAAGDAYRKNAEPLISAATAHQRAAIAVREARKELEHAKKGTDEYTSAQLNLRDATQQLRQTEADWTDGRKAQQRAADIQLKSEQTRLSNFDRLNAGERRAAEFMRDNSKSAMERAQAENILSAIEAKRQPLIDRVNAALNRQAVVSLNTRRATEGMMPVLGQAEQKLGALARRSKSTAVKIALKFDNQADVGKVAASASRALKSGVPNRIVTKIVADSSSAEQAVRRLQNVRITPKTLRIVEQGGDAALRVLTQLAGRKLTTKEQHIITRGGDAALNLMAHIIGVKLPGKTQALAERGGNNVLQQLARIIGIRIPQKTSTITANASGAFGPIQSVIGALNSIPRNVTTTVRVQRVGQVGASNRGGRASGRGAGNSERAWVGEGSRWQGAPEIIANQRSGSMSVVSQPTMMDLSPDDYVIPTEPRYRARGREFFQRFARSQGIPGFKHGRPARLPKLIGAKAADAANLKEVIGYKSIQKEEENKGKAISIAERRVKEPESLVKVIGKDANGNDLYGPDQSAMDAYSSQLGAVKALQVDMVGSDGNGGIMGRLKAAASKALSALGKYRTDRQTNIKNLRTARDRDEKLAKNKDKDTAAAAKKRLSQEKSDIEKQQSMYNSSISVTSDIQDDQQDADISRTPGYQLDLADTTDAIVSLGAKAAAEATRSNPQPQAPEAPAPGVGQPGGPTVAEDAVGRADTERALAEAGIGLNGQPPRSMADIIATQLAAEQARLAEGQALLQDSDTSNDQEGYSIIQQAASAIKSLNEDLNNLPNSAAGLMLQTSALSSAMGDLYKSFTRNFSPIVAGIGGGAVSQGVAAGAAMSGVGGLGSNAASAAGSPGVAGLAGVAGGGAGISIVQNFPEQPDPMTWARATKYEITAAL